MEVLGRVVARVDAKPGTEVYDEWARQRERWTRFAKMAIDAELGRRVVELEQTRAKLVASVILASFADMRLLFERQIEKHGYVSERAVERVFERAPKLFAPRLQELRVAEPGDDEDDDAA